MTDSNQQPKGGDASVTTRPDNAAAPTSEPEGQAANEWQPIESAPHDGTKIRAKQGINSLVAWTVWWEDCGFQGHNAAELTHWCPLPAQPAVAVSETPRTDELMADLTEMGFGEGFGYPVPRMAKFARTLERETVDITRRLAEATGKLDHFRAELATKGSLLAAVKAERDEANATLNTVLYDINYKGGLQDWQQRHMEAVTNALVIAEKLDAALADAARLREALSAREEHVRSLVTACEAMKETFNMPADSSDLCRIEAIHLRRLFNIAQLAALASMSH